MGGLPVSDELRARVPRLAAVCAVPDPDSADEHERWGLYEYAIEQRQTWIELRSCVSAEPDVSVATSVVARVLERVSPGERSAWTAAVRAEGRPFVERRAHELAILEAPGSVRASDGSWDVDDWTNWLQLRTAERSEHLALLEYHRLMNYAEAREAVQAYFGADAGSEVAIAFMRGAGLSIVDCIKLVRELTGCSLSDAKLTVHTSVAWADRRAGNERLHEELVRAVERETELAGNETVEFRGLDPWAADPNNLYIECENDGGFVDLHNFYNVGDVVLRLTEGSIFVVLERVEQPRPPANCRPFVVLGFLGVRDLEVKQAEDFDARAADVFEGVIHYLHEGEPTFTVLAADSELFFRASTVVFEQYDTKAEALRWRTAT
ncbi:hypothetical protein [Flindersiella endophytica]